MPKREENEAADYLAPTKLASKISSFSEVVSEAYLLEHGAKQRQEIAQVLGKGKARVSQIYGDPQVLKVDTVRLLLEPIKGARHRRRIVDSWTDACFGDLLTSGSRHLTSSGKVTDRTMLRVDRMIRQKRLREALDLSSEILLKAQQIAEQEILLDRMFMAHFFLDEHGAAMSITRRVIERARERKEPLREASGVMRKARLMTASNAFSLGQLEGVYDECERLLQNPAPAQAPPYNLATKARVRQSRLSARITCSERTGDINEVELRDLIQTLLTEPQRGGTLNNKYWRVFTAARCLGLLGEYFQAFELLDEAMALGKRGLVYAQEECGVLYGKFMAATERREEALQFLSAMSERCRTHADRYHQRLLEGEILRIEAGKG
jgi:tetratricopeptide (TPR) repeat protein